MRLNWRPIRTWALSPFASLGKQIWFHAVPNSTDTVHAAGLLCVGSGVGRDMLPSAASYLTGSGPASFPGLFRTVGGSGKALMNARMRCR